MPACSPSFTLPPPWPRPLPPSLLRPPPPPPPPLLRKRRARRRSGPRRRAREGGKKGWTPPSTTPRLVRLIVCSARTLWKASSRYAPSFPPSLPPYLLFVTHLIAPLSVQDFTELKGDGRVASDVCIKGASSLPPSLPPSLPFFLHHIFTRLPPSLPPSFPSSRRSCSLRLATSPRHWLHQGSHPSDYAGTSLPPSLPPFHPHRRSSNTMPILGAPLPFHLNLSLPPSLPPSPGIQLRDARPCRLPHGAPSLCFGRAF